MDFIDSFVFGWALMVVRDVSLEDFLVSSRMTRGHEPFYLNDDNLHRVVETEAVSSCFHHLGFSHVSGIIKTWVETTERGVRSGYPEKTSWDASWGRSSPIVVRYSSSPKMGLG